MDKLTKQRDSIQSKLNIFKHYIDDIEVILVVRKLSDVEVIQLGDRVERFKLLLVDFDAIQDEIELDKEVDLEDQLEERQKFENSFYNLLAKAKSIFQPYKEPVVPPTPQYQPTQQATDNVKLPTISLPKFNGDFQLWLEFRDTFKSLIHNNHSISNIQKFHYLRASCGGVAAEIIKSIQLSAENYFTAWDILCNRFNNESLLVNNHLNAIMNLKNITKESSQELRHLLDDISKNVAALRTLNMPTHYWSTILIHIFTGKLDKNTMGKWQEAKGENNFPDLQTFLDFLQERANILEKIEVSNLCQFEPKVTVKNNTKNLNKSFSNLAVNHNQTCVFCKKAHNIYNCSEFLKLTVEQRIEQAKKLKLCFNCLYPGHSHTNCKYGSCKKCNSKHSSFLHIEKRQENDENSFTTTNASTNALTSISNQNNSFPHVLLSTAVCHVLDFNNVPYRMRLLLDSGSETSFISQKAASRLNIQRSKVDLTISGIGNVLSNIRERCDVEIQSYYNTFSTRFSCLILPEITGCIPAVSFDISNLNLPNNLHLSDPNFNISSEIDILIGADLFWKLVMPGQHKIGPNGPILQESQLGWIVSSLPSNQPNAKIHCNFSSSIQHDLKKFWELEEVLPEKSFSLEEKACEAHFAQNTIRDSDGRFIVKIPFKNPPESLGDTFQTVKSKFLSLEKRLSKNQNLKHEYKSFMSEYIHLGHMSLVEPKDEVSFYLPHHGVIKEDSLTTRLRVVYNGSFPSSNGISLNEIQMVGPTIQPDLVSVLLRFRQFRYIISSDAEKMYRQILISESDRPLQRIFWRDDPNKSLQIYNLNTVTYGTASASYLAIKSLCVLAEENKEEFPYIYEVITKHMYVDDVLTGANTFQEAQNIVTNLPLVLSKGCFRLRKWASNEPELLSNISDKDKLSFIYDFSNNDDKIKTLGLSCSFKTDELFYTISNEIPKSVTKRSVLSQTAKVFDPLGLLSPTTIIPKIILQKLWLLKSDWDDPLPPKIHNEWIEFQSSISCLNELRIKRHSICLNPKSIEIHGFGDSSELGYGACVYLRSINDQNEVFIELLCGKSKVAPLQTKTIPKLELCASLLLSKLVDKVKKSLVVQVKNTFLWTDSSIVLAWIQTPPNQLKLFVSNRVSQIQELVPEAIWRHVRSSENPADLISRGVMPRDLINSKLWWNGPAWLQNDLSLWPKSDFETFHNIPELKRNIITSNICIVNFDLSKYSDLNKLERIIAYCLRFKNNCLAKKQDRFTGPLNMFEINQALLLLVKISQEQSFPNEINALKLNRNISAKSKLILLHPFLDENGALRVGGRLKNSDYHYSKKHPLILNGKNHFTKILFEREHIRLLHSGPQLLLSSIRSQFWPISGRNLSKQIVHKCIRCFKFNSKVTQPLMGNLPKDRITPNFPFASTGVDYAGPILIKDKKGRGCKHVKAYLCIFICLVTKSVHIELVTSLTSEVFILALRRFVSRRGVPKDMYSDNGTTFVGANSDLKELGQFLFDSETELSNAISFNRINWHFIPSYSPHMGGLWEAGVKSFKHHLKRVAGNAVFTYEEMYTLLVQIEGLLNSRPLTPLSHDSNDLEPLTPSHFLIGRSIISIPEPMIDHLPSNRLTNYQLIQSILQQFWRRWSLEYISQLQTRTKWQTHQSELKLNSMVLIKDDNQPPMKWKLGRIIEINYGPDGIGRVAVMKTSNGNIKRSFSKICPLPIEDSTPIQG